MSKPDFKNKYCTLWSGQYGRTIVIERSYKDKKTDEWKSSNRFFENEIPALFEALKEVMEALKGQVDEKEFNAIDFSNEDIPF